MEKHEKYYQIITYGCQMNVHESEKLAGILNDLGYLETEDEKLADVIVFNTCCIRENAEDKARGNIGALKSLKKQKGKDLIIAVCGCMTQQKGKAEALKQKFPFIDIIFGTYNLEDFRSLLSKRLESGKKFINVWEKEGQIVEGTPKYRTSFPNGWVNITYGCNNFCSYCIVPYVRGRERSRKMEDIIEECKQLISQGYKEITLLGQNVNSYGNDLENTNFSKLIKEIDNLDGDFRLRFMTNHPKDFSEELVLALKNCKKIGKSVHLPVQAGSNRILKLMNRRYTREDYLEKVNTLRKHIPDIEITTDIMVGFPTETESDFLDTLDIVKKVRFSGAFTFVYSRRIGTPAASMDGQIEESISKDRIMRLIDVQNTINRENSVKCINKISRVLCEDYDNKRKMYMGRDEYGRMVYFNGEEKHIGEFVKVKIINAEGISLIGETLGETNG